LKTDAIKRFFLRIIKTKWALPTLFAAGLIVVCVCAGVSFAKYVDEETSNKNADVAVFSIEDTITEESNHIIYLGSSTAFSGVINCKVTNNGEVAVNYVLVSVENMTNNMPITFGFSTDVKRINVGGSLEYTINVSFYNPESETKEAYTSGVPYKYSGMVDRIKVTVRCEQVG
jgi:hypothetical protein